MERGTMSQTASYHKPDIPLVLLTLTLIIFGIVMIGSADGWVYDNENFHFDELQVRQIIGMFIGIGICVLLMFCPYRVLKNSALIVYAAVTALLVLTLRFGTGAETGDEVRRWLTIPPGITLQPSEFAKLGIIMMLAWYFEKLEKHRNHLLILLGGVMLTLIPLYLIYKEPDLSTSLVVIAIAFSCFFAARVSWIYVLLVVAASLAGIYVIVRDALSASPVLLSSYQAERIVAWLHPEDYLLTTAYQSMQSRAAISSGGLFGVGLFHNSGLVPIANTDFIFGIIGEELGLVGCTVLIVLYIVLSMRIFVIAKDSNDVYSKIVCCGIAAMIGVQAAIHMGVCLAVLPNTGLTLPFISYGLSSLTANMAGIGLVMRINAENHQNRLRRYAV